MVQTTAEHNERVRWCFETALYLLGIPLLLMSVGFIVYAPICKPGIADLAVFNLTIPKAAR